MSKQVLRIATRDSPLALWQAHYVRDRLIEFWPSQAVEIFPMKTTGDRVLDSRLQDFGGKGLFVKELEDALLNDRADLAVHSMKDVPADLPPGLFIASICKRDNPLDALVSNHCPHLDSLPIGAHLGTSSLRRQAQLLLHRPDLSISPLRGNVGTRLNQLDSGKYDAIVLAAAGLKRLNLSHRITQLFEPQLMLPACGQGAVGIECRENDVLTQQLLTPLHDPQSALCVEIERKINAALNGNCQTPIGIYCQIEPKTSDLCLDVMIAGENGKVIRHRQRSTLSHAHQLAPLCIAALDKLGARELIQPHPPHA